MIQGDADLIQMMAAKGTDLSRPRLMGHFCYFETQSAADGAATSLRARGGFDVEVYQTEIWVLHASQVATLSEQYIADMRPAFTKFAEDHGGTYDGWTPL